MNLPDPRPGATAPAAANLSPLAAEVLHILQAETGYPPLSAESLSRVLWAIGYGPERVPVPEIEAALSELLAAGQVEVLSRSGVPRFGAVNSQLSGDASDMQAGEVLAYHATLRTWETA